MKQISAFFFFVALCFGTLASFPVQAAGGASAELPALSWSFDGVRGYYDKSALQRGAKVYREVCAACHSMDFISYRNLSALGYNEDEVKSIAGEYNVTDGPNDEGEMFERPARPSDKFVAPYPNKKVAAAMNNGAIPPDLSLITKARSGGADYIYALLTGYETPPYDAHLMTGQYWNKYMSGYVIAMAPPLSDGVVSYPDGSPETKIQYASDLAHFLTWAADPYMENRKRTGIKVLFFLAVFAGLVYVYKRKVWSALH